MKVRNAKTRATLTLALVVIVLLAGTAVSFAAPPQSANLAPATQTCTVFQPPSGDSYINQDKTNENKGGSSELLVKNESDKLIRSLVQFNVTGLPSGAQVQSATLSMYVKEIKGNDMNMRVHQVTRAWSEASVTWDSPWSGSGGEYGAWLDSESFAEGSKDYWATWNVWDAVDAWLTNPGSNYGLLLESPVSSNKSQVKFRSSEDGTSSKRPKLEICWSPGLTLSPDNYAQGNAGATQAYAHTIAVGDLTNEVVNLTAVSDQGWATRIYKDVNGDGDKDAGDTQITQTPAIGPNANYRILVEIDVPGGASNGVRDITTVRATGQNSGIEDTATDMTQVGFPPVADPILDGKKDDAYTLNPDAQTQDYCDASGDNLARLMSTVDLANPDYVWVILEMDRRHVDNTYGANVHSSWGRNYNLSDQDGSDAGQVILRNGNGTVIYDVTADYFETNILGSAGIDAAEGSYNVLPGNNTSLVGVESSSGYNLQTYCSGPGSCTANGIDLLSDSPPQDGNYVPTDPFFDDWQYTYLYEFRFDASAFGASGFGGAEIDYVHVSPNKTGSNVIVVEPCDGSIGDRVWRDNDGDANQESGEPGINGVMLQLYRDNGDGAFSPLTDEAAGSMFTSGDGDYDFTGLGADTYFVDVVDTTVPDGLVLTTANDPTPAIALSKGQDYNDADFGYRTLGEIEISKDFAGGDGNGANGHVAYVGQEIAFTIRITNTGESMIDVLPLEDVYDTNYLQYLNATPASIDTNDDGVINWSDLTTTLGDLAPGQSVAVTVRFRAKAVTGALAMSGLSAQALAPNWIIETWPHATCNGWSVEFVGWNSTAESWRVKVDGTTVASGTSNGNETVNGTWPAWVDLSQAHTFKVEIYEGGNWLSRSASFGPCNTPPPSDNICYAVADSGDRLVSIDRLTGGSFVDIGPVGATSVEAIALSPDGLTLYAADAGRLGTLNTSTGAYSNLGSFGTGNGSAGSVTFSDVDGLAFDAGTGVFYGSHRRSGSDLLFQINPATGAHVPNAFGSNVDYVVINTSVVGVPDIDDIAVDPSDGQMYASAGDGSNGANHRFVKVDKHTGAVTDIGQLHLSNGTKVEDMEGLSFFNDGTFYGVTGSQGGHPNRFWTISPADALTTQVGSFPSYGDYEAVACLTGGSHSSIGDRVFNDADGSGLPDGGGEAGYNGVTVNLYAGACPASGSPLRTTVTSGNGDYDFTTLAQGPYCVDVDASTLPLGLISTTGNDPLTVNLGYNEDFNDADFGYRALPSNQTCDVATSAGIDIFGSVTDEVSDFECVEIQLLPPGLDISKTADSAIAFVGDVVTYTVRITNTGDSVITVLPLEDTYDTAYHQYLGATPASDDNDNDGVINWSDLTASLGDLAPNQAVTVKVRFQALAATGSPAPSPLGAQAAALAPSWIIETWPHATCDGWSVEFAGSSSSAEPWRVKVDGTVFQQGNTHGNETISGSWPASVDLSQSHTFRVEIYEGGDDSPGAESVASGGSWLGRSVTFGPCAVNNISLTKTASVSTAALGESITYTYDVTNTGNEKLINVKVFDDMLGWITLGTTTLTAGASTSGTASYTVQLADVPGTIVNFATATGDTGAGATVSDTDDASVSVIFPLELQTGKAATPGVCEAASIQLTVSGAGGGNQQRVPLDVMLVIDRSGSMDNYGTSGAPQPISDTKAAAKQLIDQLDAAYDRVGLVDYYEWASLRHALSSNFASVKSSVDGITAGGWTNIADGIFDAQAHLSANARPEAIPIMVLLTDGVPTHKQDGTFCQDWPTSANACSNDTIAQAAAAKAAGTTMYTIGVFNYMQTNHPASAVLARSVMSAAASSPDTFYDAPSSSDLVNIFSDIANSITNVAGRDVIITDILPAGVHYVPGSANPAPQVSGQTLLWTFDQVGVNETVNITFDITLDNLVANQLTNVYPDSRVDYVDFRGDLQSVPFPETRITPQGCPTIGDFVWNDANGDGLQAGESGLGNVTLDLRADNGGAPGAVLDTITTNNNGGYRFDFVRPGTYWVEVTDSNTVLTGMNPTSGPESQTSPFGPITVAANQTYNQADFGYQMLNPDQTCDFVSISTALDEFGATPDRVSDFACVQIQPGGSIGDYVWNDANGNGLQDADEDENGVDDITQGLPIPLENVVINLWLNDGDNAFEPGIDDVFVASLTTDAAGWYDFTNLFPGDYWVDVNESTLAGGYEFIPGPESGPEPHRVALAGGGDYNNADFGYAGRGSVTGVVFYDWNEDGVQGLGEPGIGLVEVCLWDDVDDNGLFDDAIDTQVGCQTTDGQGAYNFTGQLPGKYLVVQTQPANLQDTTPNVLAVKLIVIGPSGSSTDNNFGEITFGSIGDFIFLDSNGNGVQDATETTGVNSVPVTVTNLSTFEVFTDTSVLGDYLVGGLVPGTYRVEVPISLPGLARTTASPQIVTLAFDAGTNTVDSYLDADFGYIAPTSVQLAGFTIEATSKGVAVRWSTSWEQNQDGFRVWRSSQANGLYKPVSGMIAATNSPQGGHYEWLDVGVSALDGYWYKIESLPDGVFFGPVWDDPGDSISSLFIPLIIR